MKTRIALAGLLVAALFLLAVLAVPGRAQAGATTVIIIEDTPFPCKIVKHDEKKLTVYLLEAKTTAEIEWEKLSPMERQRLKSLVQSQEASSGTPMGRKINGVEVLVHKGIRYRGIEITDRRSPSLLFIRCRGVPFMAISRKDIKKVTPIRIYEGLIYTPKERYLTRMATVQPKTAEDHFRMGEWCMDNHLVVEAGDHFAKCQLLDDSYVERCKDKKPLLDALAKKVQARKLYVQLLHDQAAGLLGRVLKTIDVLAAEYPDFEENTKLGMLKPILEKKRATMLRREVVNLFYMYMDHFVQNCAYDRVSDTPAVPIKVILTSGYIVEGTLKGGADGDVITIVNAGRTYSVKRALIAKIEQKMIQKGPFRMRTFAECKKYVTDKKGGISADIVSRIGKDLEVEEKKVKEVWGQRLSDVIEVGAGGLKRPTLVTSYHDAHWSVGSWLRGAGAGGTGGTGTTGPGGAAGSRPGTNPGGTIGGTRGTRGTRGGTGGRGGAGGQGAPKWDDPETWWKKQMPQTKAQILKAMCAEAIMKVEKAYQENCVNCGGTGTLEVMNIGVGGGGGRFKYPCSVCRGTGRFWGISYR